MTAATMTAPNVRTPKRFMRGRRPASALRQQLHDELLGLPIGALADVRVADDALPVHEDRRRPGPGAVSPPAREVVVLDHRVANAELLGGRHHLVVRLLLAEF